MSRPLFKLHHLAILLVFIVFNSCKTEDTSRLFTEISGEDVGIDFQNLVGQNDIFNILNFEHLYNGGGVAVGDFNNDDLPDLFFTGNLVDNKLYLNKGELEFEDVSDKAGIGAPGQWCSGVTTVDINKDGLLDVYVCSTLYGVEEKRKNLLFINQGIGDDGIPTFENQAEQYGIADAGHSTHAAFFDYDHDGDLDLYVLTDQLEVRSPNKFYFKRVDGSAPNTDRFYKNNGDGTFTNASQEAGILIEGYGLGINIFDLNEDGWLDIYIANDYLTNDLIYINNQDGTFTDKISDYIKHQSHSSMGCDIADINNDGLSDIITVEMLPRDMTRMKQMWPANSYGKTLNTERLGYDFQYMRNMLQVNQGTDANGNTKFGDLSYHSGVAASEWSWAVLFNDYDADGLKDLFISNGFPKDITDMDFATYSAQTSMALNRKSILEALPERKLTNFLFSNNGDLTFTDVSQEWGIDKGTFSNGAVYSDLDNDGDLDIVVNNINDPVTILRNNSKDINYLKIKLEDNAGGAKSTGAKVEVQVGGQTMSHRLSPARGYISCVDPILYFGLGTSTSVESIKINWADGTSQNVEGTAGNQTLVINYEGKPVNPVAVNQGQLFKAVSSNLEYQHLESRFVDFNIQRLLPRQYSLMGPAASVGDIDNNGELDFVFGTSLQATTSIYLSEDGEYTRKEIEIAEPGIIYEDIGTLLFDADNDDDLDLYIVSGGYEEKANTAAYIDRFYLNDGKGNFTKTFNSIPAAVTSGSCVKGADYDKDGDIDLFVGGRIKPGFYPQPVSSYILQNNSSGKDQVLFNNVSQEIAPMLTDIGMVSDASWTDFDDDGWIDLVLVGEWMAPRFFKNVEGKFEELENTGVQSKLGWWESIQPGDFDNDGDTDFIVGNLGINSLYASDEENPLYIYAKDFDSNGGFDAFLASPRGYNDGKHYPLHAWEDMQKQMNFLKKRMVLFADYAKSGVTDLFTQEELDGVLSLEANWFYTSYIENLGNGQFAMKALPAAAQVAPVKGMQVLDLNEDDFLDIVLVGNEFGGELFVGRYDALNGLVLYGDGKGNFKPENYAENGFLVDGDARALISFPDETGNLNLLATQNRNTVKWYEVDKPFKVVPLDALDSWALVTLSNGDKRKIELSYGQSHLSQSSRHLVLPENVGEVKVFASDGGERVVE